MQITAIRKCEKIGDRMDCKQKPTKKELLKLAGKINKELKKRGIECNILPSVRYYVYEGKKIKYSRAEKKANTIDIARCKITMQFANKYGRNVGGYGSGKRTRYMSWEDWVEFNDAINDVLDRERISANAKSLGGKFVQRRGLQRMTREDWSETPWRLGSRDAWTPEAEGREGWREDQEKRTRIAQQRRARKFAGLSERAIKVYEKRRR